MEQKKGEIKGLREGIERIPGITPDEVMNVIFVDAEQEEDATIMPRVRCFYEAPDARPDTGRAHDRNSRYGKDDFFGEGHTEPVTIKLTHTLKHQLIAFARMEGYTNLSTAIRELILLGFQYYPMKVSEETIADIKTIHRKLTRLMDSMEE